MSCFSNWPGKMKVVGTNAQRDDARVAGIGDRARRLPWAPEKESGDDGSGEQDHDHHRFPAAHVILAKRH